MLWRKNWVISIGCVQETISFYNYDDDDVHFYSAWFRFKCSVRWKGIVVGYSRAWEFGELYIL